MTVWQPGMRCVCIEDDWSRLEGISPIPVSELPRKGVVYTVSLVKPSNHGLALELTEVACGFFFMAYAFRPLSETRLDQFRKLLAPVDTRETV